jgi:hypothetical protein
MILKYNEFINNRSKERNQLDGICQDADLHIYHWDANTINPRVFDSIFRIEEISDSTLNRMTGNSYPEGCEVSIRDLRYLIIPHYDGKGAVRIGELVCHQDVADEFMYLFKELFRNKFPIERMELIDNFGGDDIRSMESNNTSAFNYRVISGKDKLSKHAFGMAIDINPLYNPCVRDENVNPESGEYYANRNRLNKYTLIKGDLVYKILHDKFGFSWGGDFEKCKDYQHYEK